MSAPHGTHLHRGPHRPAGIGERLAVQCPTFGLTSDVSDAIPSFSGHSSWGRKIALLIERDHFFFIIILHAGDIID